MSDSPHLILTAENPRTEETVFAEFERSEICALAQLVERLSFSDCRANAADDDEAYLMIDALAKLQFFLAGAGIAPR
ncbi:hypothetical protein [Pseudomonas fluorescens]|uniref:Uncharacterized protein n=1 Tax=Pseudomonas fluorescens TaxID=294 RepID=A0A5E7N1Z6_PSEFL|nr:hypothetical protein [Pseudomonas fluorescens]VVP31138.1 hypothetical protein PS880_04345 [Pseudomonas fluorescens]